MNKNSLLFLKLLIILSPIPFGCVGKIFSPLFYLLLLIFSLMILKHSWLEAGTQKTKNRNVEGLSGPKEILFNWYIKRLFLVFILFLLLQVIPLPLFLLKLISPEAARVISGFNDSPPSFHSLSLVPWDTLTFGFRFGVMALFFYALFKSPMTKENLFSILNTMVVAAVVWASFGIIKYLMGTNNFFLFFYPVQGNFITQRLTGTLGNSDHFAFSLELVLPLALSLFFLKLRFFEGSRSLKERFISAMNADRIVMFYFNAALLLGTAILLTGSRAGILSMIFSFLVFAQISIYLRRSHAIRKRLKFILIAISLLAVFTGVQNTVDRFLSTKIESGGRFLRWPATVNMATDFPVFGTGFGTYKHAFYLYDKDPGGVWSTHAHNDYLETVAEGGILGTIILFLLLGFLFASIVKMWGNRRHPQVRMIGIGILASLSALTIHSIFDFSLRIPTNSFLFVLILAVGIRFVTYKREFQEKPPLEMKKSKTGKELFKEM